MKEQSHLTWPLFSDSGVQLVESWPPTDSSFRYNDVALLQVAVVQVFKIRGLVIGFTTGRHNVNVVVPGIAFVCEDTTGLRRGRTALRGGSHSSKETLS